MTDPLISILDPSIGQQQAGRLALHPQVEVGQLDVSHPGARWWRYLKNAVVAVNELKDAAVFEATSCLSTGRCGMVWAGACCIQCNKQGYVVCGVNTRLYCIQCKHMARLCTVQRLDRVMLHTI